MNQFVNRFRQLRQDTNDTKKDNYQTTITDTTSSSPNSYYRTDFLIQYKSTKMKNLIPDLKYSEGLIGLQKAPEFHEEEVRILLSVFIFFCICVALCVHQTVLKFPSPARANVNRSFICN